MVFGHSVLSSSSQPYGLQHISLPFPSLSSRVCSNSRTVGQWCHPAISSSVAPFSFCLQSSPASGSFPVSWLFTWGGQSIGASVSVLPMNIQGWCPLGLAGLISLQSKGLSRVFSSNTVQRHSAFFIVQFSHPYTTTGKTITWTRWTFVGKVMSQLFNMMSRLVTAFLLRSKDLLISWFQSLSTVILELKKIKSLTVSLVSPSIFQEVVWLNAMIFVFWMLSFKPAFSLSSFTFIKSLIPLCFLS